MNDWTISSMEKRETEALTQMVPFVWSTEGGSVLGRRKEINLRSRLVKAAVESFMDGGRPVVVECGLTASFRITVEPINTISAVGEDSDSAPTIGQRKGA